MEKEIVQAAEILIVDDNSKNIQVLAKALQLENYEVEYAVNGETALDWLNNKKFDLILLDINMPGISGFDVCNQLRSEPYNDKTPIIFLSADSDRESILKGFEIGAQDYITKPFDSRELLARVKTQIENKRAKEEITKNLDVIVHKNKLINHSVKYAELIQSAVLRKSQLNTDAFKEMFSLILPRDIVSGDFYWFHKLEHNMLVGVFDSTGHGIPGAFMSILGVTLLNETVIREKNTEPHLILNRLREKVIDALGQKGVISEVRDGMDGAIINYDTQNQVLSFSGAHNSINLIRDDEIMEFKGDRMPLAHYENMGSFSKHTIETKPNDLVYLFTDGYKDQFGEEKTKKLGKEKFKEILLNNRKEPLDVQKEKLLDAFYKWKGNTDQIDDIAIIGLKL